MPISLPFTYYWILLVRIRTDNKMYLYETIFRSSTCNCFYVLNINEFEPRQMSVLQCLTVNRYCSQTMLGPIVIIPVCTKWR